MDIRSRSPHSDLKSAPIVRDVLIPPWLPVPALQPLLSVVPVEADEHLRLLVLREPAICLGHVLDANERADDERRLRPSALNQVPQHRLVPTDLSNSAGNRDTLHPQLADRHRESGHRRTRLWLSGGRSRRGPIDTDKRDAAAGHSHRDTARDHIVGLGPEVGVDAFEAHAVQAAGDAAGLVLHDLRDEVDFGEVDGDGADGSGLLEPGTDMVDAVDDSGAAEDGAVCCQEADGAGAEDDDRVAALEAGGFDSPPAGRKSVQVHRHGGTDKTDAVAKMSLIRT